MWRDLAKGKAIKVFVAGYNQNYDLKVGKYSVMCTLTIWSRYVTIHDIVCYKNYQSMNMTQPPFCLQVGMPVILRTLCFNRQRV